MLLKGITLFLGEPHPDEAYYWLWGQHPALSYFDHPALHAWTQAAMAALFGWNLFALRGLAVLTTSAILWVIWAWSRWFDAERSTYWFWLGAALFFSSPLMLLYTSIAIQDRLLIPLVLLSLHFFAAFLAGRAGERPPRFSRLYLAALFLGLAGLTKYNAALVGLGMLLFVLLRSDLRWLLRSPHFYIAGLLVVALQAPTLWWNAEHGFPSFRFHLFERVQQTGEGSFDPALTLSFVFESLVAVSPFLIVPLARLLWRRPSDGISGQLHGLAKCVLLTSTLAFLALSANRYILFYWNIVGYAGAFAVVGWFLRSRLLLALQLLYGGVVNTALIVQFTTFPVLQLIGIGEPESSALFGWSEVAAAVQQAESANGASFAAAPSWQTASKLAFALKRPDLPALTETTDAFDFWFSGEEFFGKDAIILAEPGDEGHMTYIGTLFDSVQPAGSVVIERFGQKIFRYQLYLARKFHASE